jgi:hypothetical protein
MTSEMLKPVCENLKLVEDKKEGFQQDGREEGVLVTN